MGARRPSPLKPRILIVDDEPDILDYLERVLRSDYRVERASTAEEGWARVADPEIAIVLSDHRMPGMNGLELLLRAGALRPGLVRILISGYTDDGEVAEAVRAAGIHRALVKPVDSRRLLSVLREAVGEVSCEGQRAGG